MQVNSVAVCTQSHIARFLGSAVSDSLCDACCRLNEDLVGAGRLQVAGHCRGAKWHYRPGADLARLARVQQQTWPTSHERPFTADPKGRQRCRFGGYLSWEEG